MYNYVKTQRSFPMAKAKLNVFQLLEKYLVSIGLPKSFVQIQLIPSKYESPIYYNSLAKSNIVLDNKRTLKGNETHIAIAKGSWYMFFEPAAIAGYEADGNTRETDQQFSFFETNLCNLLQRRERTFGKTPLLGDHSPLGEYSITPAILSGTARKWIDSNNSQTQVRLSKSTFDSDVFSDFRLGIQRYDYLIMLKERYNDKILAIAIPSEFVQKYDVSPIQKRSDKAISKDMVANQVADITFIAASEDNGIAEETPLTPRPAPRARSAKKGQLKYSAKPSIGRGAIRKASYRCENDPTHATFQSRRTGQSFMEPHHLIPLSKQYLFENDIDITSNIISLCPICHSQIHYGTTDEIKGLLRKFLNLRSEDLLACGIPIDEDTLFALYEL